MRTIEQGVITRNVERFLGVDAGGQVGRGGRERSWDFCFNYFQDHPQPTSDLELSCLQLGYYLASWGMLRGSTYLSRRTNASHYMETIAVIEAANPSMQGIDADRYHESEVRALLLNTYTDLYRALLPEGGRGVTLVSKVMMGVWGVVPSFDTYFSRAFRDLGANTAEQTALSRVDGRSLTLLGDFYQAHADEIEGLTTRFTTVDFLTGQPTDRHLTRAKIIDVFGFQYGYDLANGRTQSLSSTDETRCT